MSKHKPLKFGRKIEGPSAEVLELYRQLEINPLVWFQFIFPGHSKKQTPLFHLELMQACDEPRLAVAAPRRSAKSTVLGFLKPLHDITFKRKRFIVLISNTFKKAAMNLETIKKEISDNPKFREFHPGITVDKDAEGDSEIRHPDGFTTKILCKGVDQLGSARGIKFGANRPDLVIGDDMEDDELVRSPERRLQLQNDFDDVITPIGDKDTQIIIIGTILHDDSILSKLLSKDYYKEYKKMFFQARFEEDGIQVSLWPENWSLDELNQMEKDKPTVFAKEMQNDPVSGRNAKFKREDFRYYRIEHGEYLLQNEYGEIISRGNMADCVPAISCDLAWKEKRESDSCVILPGYLTPASEILVEDYVHGKGLKPTDVAEHLFLMASRLKALTGQEPAIGFEKAMLENVTQWFLKQEMRKRNRFLLTKELLWDADKITRIETRLISRYSQHVIFHKKGMGDLEHQLERHPYGTHDDLVDAEQGLVQLLQFPRKRGTSPNPHDEFETVRQLTIDQKNGRPFGKVKSMGNKFSAYRSFR